MLLWIDGFDNYGTAIGSAPSPSGVLARKYSGAPVNDKLAVYAGRLSGYAIRYYNGDYSTGLSPAALTTNATMVVGVAIKIGSIVDQSRLIHFIDGANTGIRLSLHSGGELSIYSVKTSTQLGITSGLGLLVDTWYYIEVKVVCGATGSFAVHVGGTSVLTGSGVDTRATAGHDYNTTFALVNPNNSAITTYWDDLYCLDGSGTINKDFLGNMRVSTLRPDEAGDSADFTPDTGVNFARVNEAICGDDTNYVASAVTDDQDLYGYGALGGVLPSIAGIMIETDCRETDATPFTLKTSCKSGVTESDDVGQAIGTTNYVTKRRIMETDPDTDPLASWTPTTLEAAQFGFKVG